LCVCCVVGEQRETERAEFVCEQSDRAEWLPRVQETEREIGAREHEHQ